MSEPEFYEVKNWKRFQYRDATGPLPWIKFYPDLLNDPDFEKLSDLNKGIWCMLLLIAARNEGRIPNDPAHLKRRMGIYKAPNLLPYLRAGFLEIGESCFAASQPNSRVAPEETLKNGKSSGASPSNLGVAAEITRVAASKTEQQQVLIEENCAPTALLLDKIREDKRREDPPLPPKGDLVEDPKHLLSDEVRNSWNDLARRKGYTECRVLTGKRRTALTQRAKEPFWRENWREGMSHLSECGGAFLSGQNGRSWTANLEWFLRPDTLAKILEGQYDSKDAYKGDPEWSL